LLVHITGVFATGGIGGRQDGPSGIAASSISAASATTAASLETPLDPVPTPASTVDVELCPEVGCGVPTLPVTVPPVEDVTPPVAEPGLAASGSPDPVVTGAPAFPVLDPLDPRPDPLVDAV
jgi:hypothetical protein